MGMRTATRSCLQTALLLVDDQHDDSKQYLGDNRDTRCLKV